MESFGAIPLSGTVLPEQDTLVGSLWDSVTPLNGDASLVSTLTALQSINRGTGTPNFAESSELIPSSFQLNKAPNVAEPVGSSASKHSSEPALNSINVFSHATMASLTAVSDSGQEAKAASDSLTGVAMSAPLASTSTQDIMINFQPDTSAIPAGYIKDIGEAYDKTRGFGWVRQDSLSRATHTPIDITPNARDRNRTGIYQFQDTLMHMQYPTYTNNASAVKTPAAWEYALPNGTYDVTVGVGDKPKYDSKHSINVEGVNAINRFQSSSIQEFKQATVEVNVTDGKLTIDALGGMNTKINYLHIKAEPNSAFDDSIETIISDMELSHEGLPHGVPDYYDWANQPRIGMGNNPGNFLALTAWGQLYEDSAGNPAQNTRVQIRDIMTYVLNKSDGQWHQLQNSQLVEGAAFREDFAGDVNISPDIRNESDDTISVKTGGGYNYHFWPSGRASINPNDIAGVITTVQARLIVDDLSKPDDRSAARYLLSMGGDYWSSLDAQWDNWKTNGDIGIGRFKYVEKDWQSFNMSTLSAGALRQNPPPIEPVNL